MCLQVCILVFVPPAPTKLSTKGTASLSHDGALLIFLLTVRMMAHEPLSGQHSDGLPNCPGWTLPLAQGQLGSTPPPATLTRTCGYGNGWKDGLLNVDIFLKDYDFFSLCCIENILNHDPKPEVPNCELYVPSHPYEIILIDLCTADHRWQLTLHDHKQTDSYMAKLPGL